MKPVLPLIRMSFCSQRFSPCSPSCRVCYGRLSGAPSRQALNPRPSRWGSGPPDRDRTRSPTGLTLHIAREERQVCSGLSCPELAGIDNKETLRMAVQPEEVAPDAVFTQK